jgi:4,5-DOPA dioxygenase extradiol
VFCVWAHWDTDRPEVNAVAVNPTVHDFYGVSGSAVAHALSGAQFGGFGGERERRAAKAGYDAVVDTTPGLDQGAWVRLMLMFPPRPMRPMIALSIQRRLGPEHHFKCGGALARLRQDGVLILGSGGLVHTLRTLALGPNRSARA